MRRREFFAVGLAVALWPRTGRAQQAPPVIGFLSGRSARNDTALVAAFVRGLDDTGLVENRHFALQYRWAEGQQSRLPALAAELAGQKPAVIATADSAASLAAARAAGATPIVFFSGGDPVRLGLVASFNRPGGHITGVTILGHSLTAKRLELLREIAPGHALIAFLYDANNPSAAGEAAEVTAAARTIGQKLQVFKVNGDREFDGVFAEMARQHVGALLMGAGPLFTNNRGHIASLAARHKIPAIYNLREFAEAGGLMSYGADLRDGFAQMGRYAGRILKGAKPADLPVVQPTKFELVINLKTAHALGIAAPPTLLARADEVIE